MTTKLQAEILCICFLHQTVLYPTEADHEIAIGHDYRLAWNERLVIDVNEDRMQQFSIDLLKTKKKVKKPYAKEND